VAKRLLHLVFVMLICSTPSAAEDGYDLWLRYRLIANKATRDNYAKALRSIVVDGNSPTMTVLRNELTLGLSGMLAKSFHSSTEIARGSLLACVATSKILGGANKLQPIDLANLGTEGFLIADTQVDGKQIMLITGNTEVAVLYGTYHFLRMLQTEKSIDGIRIVDSPKIKLRVLNHWDNLDRTVERGYAGFSIWDWHRLPEYIDNRYEDYARANASVGINGSVLTNVNANALILTDDYLKKVKALADVFRPYGIKVYLTARFNAPMEIGGLTTADPLDNKVNDWWKKKVKEIYANIPDFGGFLVKASSEGQPGPQNFGRTHADGANMLADALKPFGGIVMWRAFVYDNNVPDDRTKQSYNEFKPLDGKFRDNVLLQVKNGPLDFQPREPFHPLFGAMPSTSVAPEFQITQEYLGFSTHLVYLGTLFQETLLSDTYAKGPGSTVAKVVDGAVFGNKLTGIAGVSNIGSERNWTGHHFGQANWFSFGRLAWNHSISAEQIASDWVKMTFTTDVDFVKTATEMMMRSREITVNYMTPLGLHHIMGWNHHYGPAPWIKDKHRADWTSVYYHRADSAGIGFDRTNTGSNAVSQYYPEVQRKFEDLATCPEEYLLWFHHLPWTYTMKSGRNLWDELCYRYYNGAESVEWLSSRWNAVKGKIDDERFNHVKTFLEIQEKEAAWWRDACVLYFQSLSKREIPGGLSKPEKTLEHFKSLSFPNAPGIKPEW
jgi:alpha-glucuronidase